MQQLYVQRPIVQDSFRQSFKPDKENSYAQLQKRKPIYPQYQSMIQKPEMRPSSSQPRQPSVQAVPRPSSASTDKRAFSNQKQPSRCSFKELKNSTYIQQATPQSRYYSLKQVPDTALVKSQSNQQLKQIDQQEYKKLHEKLLFLENKINKIKSNIEISNSQLQKQSERSKQKPVGLAAKFFNKKDQENNEPKENVTPKELTKCATAFNLQNNKALKQSQIAKDPQPQQTQSINLDQFVTQVKQIKKPLIQQQSQLSRHQSLEITQTQVQNVKQIINEKSYSSQKPQKDDKFLYYISSVIKSLVIEQPSKNDEVIRDHIVQTIQGLEYARNLQLQFQEDKVVHLPRSSHLKTLIFDLDETLIHCNESVAVPGDIVLPITFPTGETIQASINIRPFAQQILQTLSRHFEIIVFTASHSCYANIVLDYLDPKKQWISHRLFREHCLQTEEGAYVKDLRVLGNRKMSNILLIDNASYSFGQQIDNGVPIVAFYDNKQDQELLYLQNYLMKFRMVTDVRELNSQQLKMSSYTNFQDPMQLVQELFPDCLPK